MSTVHCFFSAKEHSVGLLRASLQYAVGQLLPASPWPDKHSIRAQKELWLRLGLVSTVVAFGFFGF